MQPTARFVPNSGHIATQLSKKLKKGEPRTFASLTQEEHDALETLQDNLISAPVLALTRSKGHSTLGMEACDNQMGCVWMQEQPGGDEKATHFLVQDAQRSRAELRYNK